MNSFKVSILIPVWNQEKLIIKCLDSVPRRKDLEILVRDDGSIDNTWNNLLEYIKRPENAERNIKLFRNETNRGVSYTLNRLMDEAKGEYFDLIGSDDYYYTEELEAVIDELDGTDFVFYQCSNNYGMVELNEHNKCGQYKFMRTEFMKDYRNDEFRLAGEDYHLWKKILKANPTIKILNIKAKHYNYPRIGSLCWQLNEGLIDIESGLRK